MRLCAVAVNVAVMEFAGMLIVEEGAGSSELLLAKETEVLEELPAFIVTVQVVPAPETKLVGLHASEDRARVFTRLMVKVCDAVPRVALSVIVVALKTAPGVMEKVVLAEPAGTVTDEGTLSSNE